MEFEWDDTKRLRNIAKHGLDFRDVYHLFGAPTLRLRARQVADESRWLAIGLISGVVVTVINTYRAETVRVISLRRARNAERKNYHKAFGD